MTGSGTGDLLVGRAVLSALGHTGRGCWNPSLLQGQYLAGGGAWLDAALDVESLHPGQQ